ncbi:hypothetical protein [Corallococcus aberystwythensis]|uniref:hypothetical protein n=1 Tax=Corallococcus aberystwythensis TaxID=2316722 RepID=UPI000EA11448|nr:hypothetical protein [Corallococcus aberystwythensis]
MHRSLLLTCVASFRLVTLLAAHAWTAPAGSALKMEEQHTLWNIHGLRTELRQTRQVPVGM